MKTKENVNSLQLLQDEYLLDCYADAVKYDLDQEFIQLFNDEINRRKLKAPSI